jgi:hypothetical protein
VAVPPGVPPPVAGAHPVPTDDGSAPTPVEAATRGGFMEQGRKFGRAPTAFERKVFDLHGVPSTLDTHTALLTRRMAAIRKTQLTTVAARIAQKDGRKTGAFTDIRHSQVPMPLVSDIVKVIRTAQGKALAYGRQTVHDELTKQGAVIPTAKQLANTASTNKRTANSALVSSAQITARKQGDAWQSRILDTGLRIRRTGVQGADLASAIVADLLDEVESGAKRDAAGEVHEAFGLGRAGAAQDLSDLIEDATYSAILDANTCGNCEDLDGETFSLDSPEYDENLPPNVNCDGADSCRCVYLYQAVDASEADA